MSSSTPLVGSTEDNNQEKTMANTKVPSEDKSGSDSTVTEKNRENKIVKKYLNLHWINQGLLQKLKHNGQRNKILSWGSRDIGIKTIYTCFILKQREQLKRKEHVF